MWLKLGKLFKCLTRMDMDVESIYVRFVYVHAQESKNV